MLMRTQEHNSNRTQVSRRSDEPAVKIPGGSSDQWVGRSGDPPKGKKKAPLGSAQREWAWGLTWSGRGAKVGAELKETFLNVSVSYGKCEGQPCNLFPSRVFPYRPKANLSNGMMLRGRPGSPPLRTHSMVTSPGGCPPSSLAISRPQVAARTPGSVSP